MATITVQIPNAQVAWFEQMVHSLGWAFRQESPTSAVHSEEAETITPAMRRRISRARKQYAEGQTIKCETMQEMQQFFDSL